MYVVTVNGSPKTDGNTAFLLDKIEEELHLAKCERINVQKALDDCKTPFCKGCAVCSGECYKGTQLFKAFEKMTEADVLIFGTPVYFGSISAQLKALFDKSRVYRKRGAFIGKYAAAVAVGGSAYGGQENAIRALQDAMLVQGMTIIGDGCYGFDAGHGGICANRPAKEDQNAIKRCQILAKRIMSL